VIRLGVSVLVRPPDVIDREPVAVMLATCADELQHIQRLWPWFEERVGLRGRKMYATADDTSGTYTTCTPLRPDDGPQALGLEVGELPSGRFRRGQLQEDPPALYSLVVPGFDELKALGSVDQTRALVEFYKRHDEIELWLPVLAS
jgi:hypothetical protein